MVQAYRSSPRAATGLRRALAAGMPRIMGDAMTPHDASSARDLEIALAFDPLTGLADLDPQLAELRAQADAVGISFDRHSVRNELQAATFRLRAPARVRLLIGRAGAIAIEISPATSSQS
jgi:hypothetical protein